MTTNAVGSVTNNSTISLQDFMQVLMTQLTYQDPLKPMDNQEFLAQIAQFTTLQQSQQINTNVQSLLSNQAVQQSVGLIGHVVNITTTSGPQTGTVSSIDLSGTAPTISITTSSSILSNISLSQITSIAK